MSGKNHLFVRSSDVCMQFGANGPDGQDWRVPVSEIVARRKRVSDSLASEGMQSVIVEDPVELYWLTGGRQRGILVVGATDSGVETTHWVRKSLSRARWESGGDDAPDSLCDQPRSSMLEDGLRGIGVTEVPAMLQDSLPTARWSFLSDCLSSLSPSNHNASPIIHKLREVKSDWEIDQIRTSGSVNQKMFSQISKECQVGMTELEVASIAEKVSRREGFGGRIRMRRWPMDCDRAVIVTGRSGGVPSFFDSAVGGFGSNPIAPLGSGHRRIKEAEPVLVDLVHVHRGYVSDCTRMYSFGNLSQDWLARLDDMAEIRGSLIDALNKGESCARAWELGRDMALEMGYEDNLMGIAPHQAKFLGHSVGLELDETPVLADRFIEPMIPGNTMAIEPKVVYADGAIGTEDTWYCTKEGLKCLTGGSDIPDHTELSV